MLARSLLLVVGAPLLAGAINVPNNARRINVYGVGTLIDGYGLQTDGDGLIVDPVLATLEATTPQWQLLADELTRNKAAESNSGAPGREAARKLVVNHANVLRDVTNAMPRSQLHLKRLAMDEAPYADEALRETCRRMMGTPEGWPEVRPVTHEQAKAWVATATYMTQRLQARPFDCPGRAADMSEAAAAAMRTALAEVESVARAMMEAEAEASTGAV